MNAYRFNGMAGWLTRLVICKSLGIPNTLIYKKVKSVFPDGKLLMDDGKVYELTLTEIKNEQGKEGM